ncbi:MAG: hypothetical protein ACE5K4_12310 [Candidatus Hydrothermarchaeota archaeon]
MKKELILSISFFAAINISLILFGLLFLSRIKDLYSLGKLPIYPLAISFIFGIILGILLFLPRKILLK